jgi:hypothetical protein
MLPSGTGYLLVTGRGAVHAFGRARRFSAHGTRVPASGVRIVAIAANDSTGYWLIGSKGQIYAYGSATRYSVGAHRTFTRPIVAGR